VRFAIGDAIVDITIDDDDFVLPLSQFLPGCDPEFLESVLIRTRRAKREG
jgi:hypothetical protein